MESLFRPLHRKKHFTATNASSSSFSLMNPYDDVLFSNGRKSQFGAHEYAEIFFGSPSIPVLDLSGLGERVGSGDFWSSKLDYSSIFGGLRDDEVAVPYLELVNGAQKKAKTSYRIPADSQSPYQESVFLHPSRKAKRSSGDASDKHHFSVSFNKTSRTNRDPSNGEKTHIEGGRHSSSMKREVSRTWSFTAGVEEITVKGGLIPEKSRAPDKSCDLNEIKLTSHIPLFDEELDENSVAAVSAAALKKAIEQAQESIRLAKMIMERKKEGVLDGSIPRSKGRLRKDKKKIRTDREAERVRENVGAAKEQGDASTEVGKKFVTSCNPTETSYVTEIVDLENVAANEACRDAELAERAPNSSAHEALEQCRSTAGPANIAGEAGGHLIGLKSEFSNCLLNKSGSLAEKHMLEQEEIEKNYENVPDLKENCLHGKCIEEEVSETEPEIFPEIGEEVNEAHELEIDEKKLKGGHDGDGQNICEEYEQNEIAERHLDTFECLAAQTIHTAVDAHIYSETQKHYEVKGYNENDSLRRCASEENFIGSTQNDGFEGISSDSRTENVGLMDGHHEQALPEDEDTTKTAGEAHNEAEEFDHTNVMEGTLENKEGSISTHGSQEFAENAKEELKNDIDMTSDEREYVKEQNERDQNLEKNKEHFKEQKDSKRNEQKFETDDQEQRIEAIKRGREREKDRIAVERAIREARERAFAEARERAFAEARERAERERAAGEARQRVKAEAREMRADKVSIEAKLRAERAAVERDTAEARERALEKARSQKTSTEGFYSSSKSNGLKHSFSSSDLEKFDGTTSESAQRRKARLERHQRIMERSAKALAEKNMRDVLAQKELAERNRLAESLDADIKRWVTGKEGNLRALLSTLQYILGSDSGWQAISLTEIITTAAVNKAYRKATLCVHPDKLQQRRASIKQKYICEKVFDLLKAAWNMFNSEER